MADTRGTSTLYSLTAASLLLELPRERVRELALARGVGRTRFGVRDALLFTPADIEALRERE